MQEKLTSQDIARLAGISKAIVSRVLNCNPSVDSALNNALYTYKTSLNHYSTALHFCRQYKHCCQAVLLSYLHTERGSSSLQRYCTHNETL